MKDSFFIAPDTKQNTYKNFKGKNNSNHCWIFLFIGKVIDNLVFFCDTNDILPFF